MLPVLVIVGRPNVGKSTLFNRLTKSRNALTSNMPGMTRDRQYGEGEIHHQKAIIIDTGGIVEHPSDAIEQSILQQANQAIKEADAILFVVDGQAGFMPDDDVIAKTLRPLNKPIYLVVNKSDTSATQRNITEFYPFGFGTLYPVSAAHGTGIEALFEEIFSNLPKQPEKTNSQLQSIHLAIIGRPNVGKSTLTNRMLGEERVIVCDQPGTTRDSIFIPLERFGKQYTLIDTAGVRRRTKVSDLSEKFSIVKTLQAIENTHVVLFLIDGRAGVTEQDLKLLGFIWECGKCLVIAVNKWDGMDNEMKEKTRAMLDRQIDFLPFIRTYYISALHGTNVGHLFEAVDEAYTSATRKLTTPELTRLLLEAVKQHEPPLVRGRRIKLRYAHAGGHNPPIIVIHGNQLKSLSESYKRYLVHTFQKKLKLYGTPIHIQLKYSDNPYQKNKKKT